MQIENGFVTPQSHASDILKKPPKTTTDKRANKFVLQGTQI